MFKPVMTIVAVALGLSATSALGQALTPEEQAFLRQHLAEIVSIQPVRVSDPAVLSVFAAPIYQVTVEIREGGGTNSNNVLVARLGDTLVAVSRPGEDSDCPGIQKMFRPDFKLTGNDAGETLQRALDAVYPIIGDEDKAARTFRHKGSEWTFVRGKFFDNVLGFVLTTDASGAITGVRFALKLPS
jgi:hypothetical protein